MTDTSQTLETAIARMQQIDRLLEEIGTSLPAAPPAGGESLSSLFDKLMAEANAAHGRFHRVAKQMMDMQKALAPEPDKAD